MKEYVALMVRARNGGSYLTLYHSEQKYWCFPGGKPEPGETWSQALVREIREELAIEASEPMELLHYGLPDLSDLESARHIQAVAAE